MKCPECGKEMEEGYLVAAASASYPWGLSWTTGKNIDYVTYSDSSTRPETETLVKPGHIWEYPTRGPIFAKASRCNACRFVQFHY